MYVRMYLQTYTLRKPSASKRGKLVNQHAKWKATYQEEAAATHAKQRERELACLLASSPLLYMHEGRTDWLAFLPPGSFQLSLLFLSLHIHEHAFGIRIGP